MQGQVRFSTISVLVWTFFAMNIKCGELEQPLLVPKEWIKEDQKHQFVSHRFSFRDIIGSSRTPFEISVGSNKNNYDFIRSGHGVSHNGNGIQIDAGGFLYERLSDRYIGPADLYNRAFRIDFTSPVNQNVMFYLIQKINPTESNMLSLKLSSKMIKEAAKDKQTTAYLDAKSFGGVDCSKSFALLIRGPVTVHYIGITVYPHYRYYDSVIDDCTSWKKLFIHGKRILFESETPYTINANFMMRLNIGGGGGETMDLYHNALNITYSALDFGGKRKVQVLQDVWKGEYMSTRVSSDWIDFKVGRNQVIIVKLENIQGFSSAIIHGPLMIHHVEMISTLPNGSVQAD